ncbi:MAG: hypothetical protein P4L40_05115 [Terracidiphilus sp.]|nr:hypothetical protein [Terracidiphilus sp.]
MEPYGKEEEDEDARPAATPLTLDDLVRVADCVILGVLVDDTRMPTDATAQSNVKSPDSVVVPSTNK